MRRSGRGRKCGRGSQPPRPSTVSAAVIRQLSQIVAPPYLPNRTPSSSTSSCMFCAPLTRMPASAAYASADALNPPPETSHSVSALASLRRSTTARAFWTKAARSARLTGRLRHLTSTSQGAGPLDRIQLDLAVRTLVGRNAGLVGHWLGMVEAGGGRGVKERLKARAGELSRWQPSARELWLT